MAKFGQFTFINELYGFSIEVAGTAYITSIEVVHPRLVRLIFSSAVSVDSAFYDINNYEIGIVNGGVTDANPVRILTPYKTDSSEAKLSTTEVFVVTQPLTIGTNYSFTVSGLTGLSSSSSLNRLARRTKTQSAIRSLPPHFDSNFDSNIAGILTAISMSDDLIGGNQDEYTGPTTSLTVLLTEAGDTLITEGGFSLSLE